MPAVLLPAVLLLAVLLAGCAGQEPATGQLAGRLLSQGGGAPGQRPMPGTVAITAGGHPPITVRVPKSGNFSVQLPPGRYDVSGPCSRSLAVTVTAQHTTRINIICTFASGRPPR
jgi:hypothetical protein